MTLVGQNAQKFQIKWGLINSIDNTAYITTNNQNSILQIEVPPMQIESLNLEQFIDSRLFPYDLSSLIKVGIYLHKANQKVLIASLENTSQKWGAMIGKSEKLEISNSITQEKIIDFIRELLSYQSELVLDRPNPEIKKIVDKNLANCQYTIEITSTNPDRSSSQYSISHPITEKSSEIKNIDKAVVVKLSYASHPVLTKNHLSQTIKNFLSSLGVGVLLDASKKKIINPSGPPAPLSPPSPKISPPPLTAPAPTAPASLDLQKPLENSQE
jgi:hypothetical protein